MSTDIGDQLTKYLADAHSIEDQALAQLKTAPDLAGEPELAEAFRSHEAETVGHEQLVKHLLEARGESTWTVKDTVGALAAVGARRAASGIWRRTTGEEPPAKK